MYNLINPHQNLSLKDTNKYISLKSFFKENFYLHDYDYIIKKDNKVDYLPSDNDNISSLGDSLIIKSYNKDLYLRIYLTNFEEFLYSIKIKIPYYHSKGYEEDYKDKKWNNIKYYYNLLLDQKQFFDIPLNLPKDYIISLNVEGEFAYISKEYYFDITSANIHETTFEGLKNTVEETGYIDYPSRITIKENKILFNETDQIKQFKTRNNKFTEFLIDYKDSDTPVFELTNTYITEDIVINNCIFTNVNPLKKFKLFNLTKANKVIFNYCTFYDFHYNIFSTNINELELNNCNFVNCEMKDYFFQDRQIKIKRMPIFYDVTPTIPFYLHNLTDNKITDNDWKNVFNGTLSNQYNYTDIYNINENIVNPAVITLKPTFNPLYEHLMEEKQCSTYNNNKDHSCLIFKNIFLNNSFYTDYNYCTYAYFTFYIKYDEEIPVEEIDKELFIFFDNFNNKNDVFIIKNDYLKSSVKNLYNQYINEFEGLSKTFIKLNPNKYNTWKKIIFKIPYFNDFNINDNYYIGLKIPYGFLFNRLSFKLDLQKK